MAVRKKATKNNRQTFSAEEVAALANGDSADRLSLGDVSSIYWAIRDGNASPDDVKRLFAHFYALLETGETPPQELLMLWKIAFRAYLREGERALLRSLGIIRTKANRPKVVQERNQKIAAAVLYYRLEGNTLDEAAEKAAAEFQCGETQVREAWATNKESARRILEIANAVDGTNWTREQLERLTRIYDPPTE